MENIKIKELIIQHSKYALNNDKLYFRDLPDLKNLISIKPIIVITGVRRCGKSSLMRLIIKDLLKEESVSINNIIYINFEDERFVEFTYQDFDNLYEIFLEIKNPYGKKYLFFDEIQNIKYWHRWINRMYEFEDVKIFITGSNASLLSSEIASSLTGRNIPIRLYPLSFKEYLRFNQVTISDNTIFDINERVKLKKNFSDYLNTGGFPEAVINNDPFTLQYYFQDILLKDIVSRLGIKNVKEMKGLGLYLSSNISKLSSYRKISAAISIKSTNTVKNYLDHLENAFLFFRMGLFDFSLKKQFSNPYKMYCVDTAIARSVAFKFSQDLGRIYENIVFIELLRRNSEIYYWRSPNNNEVDFIIRQGMDITNVIQVTVSLSSKNTETREMRSLLEAANMFELNKGTIITEDESAIFIKDNIEIRKVPIWQWLLNIG